MEFLILNGVTFMRVTAGGRFRLRLPTWPEVAMLREDNPEVFDAKLGKGTQLYVIDMIEEAEQYPGVS